VKRRGGRGTAVLSPGNQSTVPYWAEVLPAPVIFVLHCKVDRLLEVEFLKFSYDIPVLSFKLLNEGSLVLEGTEQEQSLKSTCNFRPGISLAAL
jgi:hypothetical protein